MVNPCIDCLWRWVDPITCTRCHSTCDRYIAYAEHIRQVNVLAREERNKPQFITSAGFARDMYSINKKKVKKYLGDNRKGQQ